MDTISVLIVDDVADWREVLEEITIHSGYKCKTVGSIKEAIEILNTYSIKLAIIDLRLEDCNLESIDGGLTIVKWVVENNINTKIIMLSAFGTPRIIKEAYSFGVVVGFFSKTRFDTTDFIDLLEKS